MRFKPKMGFVKIYRDMLNQEPFKHRPDIFLFYVYLVSKISFGNDTIEIKCEELAKVFGKNRATIANWLKELKAVQLIDIKTNNRFTSITLIPVELIDDDQNATSHQIDIGVTSKPLEYALILSSGPSKNIEDKNKEELHNALLSEQKSLDEELKDEPKVDSKWIIETWNHIAENFSNTMNPIIQIPERSERKRIALSKKKKEWERVFELIKGSPFLLGKTEPKPGKKRFSLKIDWILKPVNWNKTLEGSYNEKFPAIVKEKKNGGGAAFKSIFAGKGKSLAEFDAEHEAASTENFLEPEYVGDDGDERF